MGWVRLGRVVRAVSLDGRVGVAGTEGALSLMNRVELRRPGSADREFRVLGAGPQGRIWWLRLDGIADRTAAEALVGNDVWGRREAMGDAGQDLHFWTDLEGLPVVTTAGEELGKVEELFVTGGVDVLVVRGPGGERLVPLAPYVTVDRERGRVVVDPPPGLLAADEEEAGRTERKQT
ncbi:MAG: ribosome maturation factor RimM [Deltaproteobacteria bacterium]|jgi:16S rRNA processing protein RimM|nr:ribosome maturation factor RimM [Deltaproteobacteria bacterium]